MLSTSDDLFSTFNYRIIIKDRLFFESVSTQQSID